jgi:para-nitrobenzyl esterase
MSEDMLKLNVWTPSLIGKRPVIVYFHGGGFSFGSSYELPSHEGAQMARHHAVVKLSLNHRLNVLGFFDASEVGGSAYDDSVNVGMTDLIASLRWVRENMSCFGGDPDKVMIYGQSGGGSRVATLLGMRSAAWLIHRASVQSGGGGNIPTGEQQKDFARQVIKELAIASNDIGALQKMEWSKLVGTGNAVAAKMNPPMRGMMFGPPSGPGMAPRVGWSPTLDGRIINVRAFQDVAPEVSKNVPMLIGSVSEEGKRYRSNQSVAEWHETLAKSFGEPKATAPIEAMKKAHPEKSIRTLSYGVSGLGGRTHVQSVAKLKYERGGAPVDQYFFTWQSPMLGGDAGHGRPPNSHFVSTTQSGANRVPGIHQRHSRWERRWPRRGPTSPGPETPVNLV